MKVLTVRQPWADAITELGKTIENRTWATPYRGPVAIHAGTWKPTLAQRKDPTYSSDTWQSYKVPMVQAHDFWLHERPRGVIIAVAELGDVHPAQSPDCDDACVIWVDVGAGIYHWRLDNVEEIIPIACVGSLGLRDLPENFEATIQTNRKAPQ